MAEIELPPALSLTQEHGRVSWAVKSIWEYYATWFHFDRTTELYAVPQSSVYSDILAGMGAEFLLEKAQVYVRDGEALKALHLLDIISGAGQDSATSLGLRRQALQILLARAEKTHKNAYEIYWLNSRIDQVEKQLELLHD